MSDTSHDRWFSFVSIFPGEVKIEDFLRDLVPTRGDELFVVSDIRMGGVPYQTKHIFRRSADPGSFASAFLITEDGQSSWGMYVDLAGTFPRKVAQDALGAIGLDFATYGDKLSIFNSMDIDLNNGVITSGSTKNALRDWMTKGVGMVVISTSTDRDAMRDANRLIPDFYGAILPVVHTNTPEFRAEAEEILGLRLRSNSVSLIGRKPMSDSAEILFSGLRKDKMTARRLHRAIAKTSSEYSDIVAKSLSIPAVAIRQNGSREAEEKAATAAEAVADETLLSRIKELETDLSKAQNENRKLVNARHREETIAARDAAPAAKAKTVTAPVAVIVSEPEVSDAQRAIDERQDEVFTTFGALIEAARTLPNLLVRDGIEETAKALDSLPTAQNWRNQTWKGLLAMNEYAEAISSGRFSGNLHEYLTRHPHPLIGKRRVAMRESNTVRDSDLYMRERVFSFDGEPVAMEAHYKIDLSGKHPAPRLHFDLHDGVIRVGYIGAHLRTKRTN